MPRQTLCTKVVNPYGKSGTDNVSYALKQPSCNEANRSGSAL